MGIYDVLTEHRSYRNWKDMPVEEEKIEKLLNVYRHAPSSVGMFTSSIIRVKDPEIKRQISEVCTQEYVATAPELFVFLVDLYRNKSLYDELTDDNKFNPTMNYFMQGFTDAVIGTQTVECLAEEMGLASVYLGSILNDYDRIIEILDLPKLTFPVVGLAFGYPDPEFIPMKKPKMENHSRVFTDKYKLFDSYKDELKDFSDKLTSYKYVGTDAYSNDFFTNVVNFYSKTNEKRERFFEAVKKQGFSVDV